MSHLQGDQAKDSGGGAAPVATGAESAAPGSGFASADSSLESSPVKIPLARGSSENGERRRVSHEVCWHVLRRASISRNLFRGWLALWRADSQVLRGLLETFEIKSTAVNVCDASACPVL